MAPVDRLLDGCPGFDERLLDAAFAPTVDAALDEHLASCARCREARDRYLRAADAIGAALALEPARRPRRTLRGAVAAAILAAAALAAFLVTRPSAGLVNCSPGVRISSSGAGAWSLDEGAATFVARGSRIEVATPLGLVHAEEGRFTVNVDRTGGSIGARSVVGSVAVTLAVATGIAVWDGDEDEPTVVYSGETAARRSPKPAASEDDIASTAIVRARPAKPEPAPFTATVVGFGRAVDAETGEPVAGAPVAALAFAAWSASVVHETVTAADGTFRLAGLASGCEAIRVLSPAHAAYLGMPRIDPTAVRAAAEAARQGRAPAPLDLGEVRLARGARVSGLVRREDRSPVPGAVVLSFGGGFPLSGGVLLDARELGWTDADGRFALREPIGPDSLGGAFLAAVSADGIGWAPLALLAGRDAIDDVEIVVGAGADVTVNVIDSSGAPVPDAIVSARPRFRPFDSGEMTPAAGLSWLSPRADVQAIFVATTDGDGRAALPRLPIADPGEYVVTARLGDRTHACPTRAFAAGERSELTLRLPDLARIAISGRVTDAATGRPVRGARVWTFEGDTAESDADGRYSIESAAFPSGGSPARLSAAADGYAANVLALPRPAVDAARLDDVDVVLERAARVRGRVVDESGAAVAGACVNVHRRGYAPRGTVTDASGRFDVADASESDWALRVQPPEPYDEWRTSDRPLVVKGGGPDLLITLERRAPGRARLVAEVFDAATGEALDPHDVELAIVEAGRTRWAGTLQDRGVVTAERLRAGTWLLSVADRFGRRACRDFTVSEDDDEVRLRIEIADAGSLEGRVEGVSTAAGPRARAVLRGPSFAFDPETLRGVRFGAATVGRDGSFRIANLVPGDYLVVIEGGGVAGAAEAVVLAGEATRVTVAAERSARVEFRTAPFSAETWVGLDVTRPDGTALPATAGHAVDAGQPLSAGFDVRPGRLAWTCRFAMADLTGRDAAAPQSGEVVVEAGETVEVVVPVVPPRND